MQFCHICCNFVTFCCSSVTFFSICHIFSNFAIFCCNFVTFNFVPVLSHFAAILSHFAAICHILLQYVTFWCIFVTCCLLIYKFCHNFLQCVSNLLHNSRGLGQVFSLFFLSIHRPPRGIVPYYNMTESIISRDTCDFLLKNQVAMEFREWLQDIKAPEEFFYATLARVDRQSALDLDRKVYMDPDVDTTQGICPRYSNWNPDLCHGKMKRWICNFSIGDLPRAINSQCLWMNKFDLSVDPRPIICMHEYLTQ